MSNRFDVHDRKGLEIVLLSALLSFQDYNESYRLAGKREDSGSSIPQLQQAASSKGALSAAASPATTSTPNLPPPRPPKSGLEQIAALQSENGIDNIVIFDEGSVGDYATYCSNMLQVSALFKPLFQVLMDALNQGDVALFIVIRSSSPETVSKVLQVVHETKRILHTAGDDDDLFQYVQYDTDASSGKKGPRVIKLDDSSEASKYRPPSSLTVHLSKIPMPELQPKLKAPPPPPPLLQEPDSSNKKDKSKSKDEKKRLKEKEKREREEAEANARRGTKGKGLSKSRPSPRS